MLGQVRNDIKINEEWEFKIIYLIIIQIYEYVFHISGQQEIMNEKHIGVEDRSCIALGSNGCEGNDAKCCRDGNPYTGTMRKCRNTGSFSSPVFTCQD